MQRKQCPRCGNYLAEEQQIHWPCVLARCWHLFKVPISGAVVAAILLPILLTVLDPGGEAAAEFVAPTETATIIPTEFKSPTPQIKSSRTPRPSPTPRATRTPQATATSKTEEPTMAITPIELLAKCPVEATNRANLRSAPNLDSDTQDFLKKGEEAQATGYHDNLDENIRWWQLSDGLWVSTYFVNVKDDCASLDS